MCALAKTSQRRAGYRASLLKIKKSASTCRRLQRSALRIHVGDPPAKMWALEMVFQEGPVGNSSERSLCRAKVAQWMQCAKKAPVDWAFIFASWMFQCCWSTTLDMSHQNQEQSLAHEGITRDKLGDLSKGSQTGMSGTRTGTQWTWFHSCRWREPTCCTEGFTRCSCMTSSHQSGMYQPHT